MKILIPDIVKSNLHEVESIQLELARINPENNNSEFFISSNISISHANAIGFVELHEELFKSCVKIRYKVLYKNGITKIFKFDNKHQATFKLKDFFSAPPCIRYKKSSLFEDSDIGRGLIVKSLNRKIVETHSCSLESKGTKNLICYTAYFDNEYLTLLDMSVNSILTHSTAEFDLLIITDEPTKELIELLPFNESIVPKFHITPTPLDGVEASQNKTKIFDYKDIDEYDKILFVDCDVMALKDINVLFKQDLEPNTLYVAHDAKATATQFKTLHYGFDFIEDSHIEEMEQANQIPFNAGQFLFKNSDRMREHFANLNWMIDNWSGEYFFEQCFMNYYFCKAHLTECTSLQKHTSIISTLSDLESTINQNTCLVHFVGPPLNAAAKVEFINNFLTTREIPSFVPGLTTKTSTVKLPKDFSVEGYRKYNTDIAHQSDDWLKDHYVKYAAAEKRIYKVNLPVNFDVKTYRNIHPDLANYNDSQLEWHYEVHGRHEGRRYSLDIQTVNWNEPTLTIEERVQLWSSSALYKHESCIVNSSKTTNAIVIFSSRERNYLSEVKLRNLNEISKQWNCDLILIEDPLDVLTQEQLDVVETFKSFRSNIVNYVCKILSIHKALTNYERVVWMDDTCAVSPFAPSLFAVVPEDSIGALIVPRNCGLAESMSDYKYLLQHKKVSINDEYYNTGVMVIPAIYKDLFSFKSVLNNKELFQSPYPTQAWQNYLTHINNCKIFDLTCMYNMMPCCYQYDNSNWNNTDITDLYPELLKYYIVHFTGFHRNREIFHHEFLELQQSVFADKITVVIMNFKRPDNIKDYILPYYETILAVDEIIVVHCNQETVFEYQSKKVQHVYEFNTNKEYGVFTRYIAAKEYATNECILFTDDDVVVPGKTISALYYKWKENTNRIVGVEGRKIYRHPLTKRLVYRAVSHHEDVDFVLTSSCMASYDNVVHVCDNEHKMRKYAKTTKTKWNGEDIYLGLLTTLRHGTSCFALPSPVKSLSNQEHAISDSTTHLDERSGFLNYFVEKFQAFDQFIPNVIRHRQREQTDVFVRCEEGFGNQLRMLLAGTYLVQAKCITSYTQEWVLNNHNNVDFLEYFEEVPGVNIVKKIEGVSEENIIKASTFKEMIHFYGFKGTPWTKALSESFAWLRAKPEIQKKANDILDAATEKILRET